MAVTTLRDLLDGKYEMLGQLDVAGPGEVYKVRHLFLDEVRVLRVVPLEGARSREAGAALLEAARAAMRLRHPNIAQLHEFSLDEAGTAFIVLEDVEGLPLDTALRELGPPPVGLGLEVAQQALGALGVLHRGGKAHRDVAPERLMLARDVDGRPLVKWTDLGIARLLAGTEGEVLMGGLLPPHPRQAAPEQFGAGGREPDARSDLYSFGLLLYELLTGRFPISGHDPFSWMAGHLSAAPLDFAESDPQGRLPAELRELLLQTLAKDPAQRPAGSDELARRLRVVADRFPEEGDYLDRVLRAAAKRAPALRPMALPPKPEPEPPPPSPPPPEPTLIAPLASVAAPVQAVQAPVPAPPPEPPVPEPVLRLVPPVTPPAPDPELPEDLPLRGVAPARQLEWDRPREDYGTQRVQIEAPPVPVPVRPARPAPPVEPRPAPAPPVQPAESNRRRLLIGAAVALVAIVGGALGAYLGRGADTRPAPPANANPVESPSQAPATNTQAPQTPATVEVTPQPVTPPPPDNEKAEAARVRREQRALEEARRRQEATAVPPPMQMQGAPAVAEPMHRGDLITPGPGVEYPEPATEISAAYPRAALESRRAAKVRVAVLVDENGNVIQSRIREGDPSGLGFNEAAQEAARRVRFLPATREGVPGKFWFELLYEFDPPPAPAPAPPADASPATPPPGGLR